VRPVERACRADVVALLLPPFCSTDLFAVKVPVVSLSRRRSVTRALSRPHHWRGQRYGGNHNCASKSFSAGSSPSGVLRPLASRVSCATLAPYVVAALTSTVLSPLLVYQSAFCFEYPSTPAARFEPFAILHPTRLLFELTETRRENNAHPRLGHCSAQLLSSSNWHLIP